MKDLSRWLRRNKKEPLEDIDLESIASIVQMVEPAEPDDDLLSRIERRIDNQIAAEPERWNDPVFNRRLVFAALAVGVLIGLSGPVLLQSRQSIVAQTGTASPWIPLGSVSLHGNALRSFVRAKCEGQTHFFITMHGFHSDKDHGKSAATDLLMKNEEKILMECIF